MASINNLIVSWNYDVVTGSNASGEFLVLDTANSYNGKSHSFAVSNSDFVLKEDLVTNKTLNFETLEGKDTISIRDEDDISISSIKKPSSLELLFENSMYQIMSDEMINMFSSIDAYVFKFAEPYNRYKDSYQDLDQARERYFSKILSNPNLEKYIEFYKWIDSSLGTLLENLKPASTNNQSGLKYTVESHLLERNKFKHKLPLTFQPNRTYENSGIKIINSGSLNSSSVGSDLADTIENVYNSDQSVNRNSTYDSFQTAGKFQNNRSNKTNKSVFITNFSAGDGLSEKNRYVSGSEFSIYNTLNLRAKNVRDQFNLQEASVSHYSNHQKDDNNFIRFNIPYTASNYANLNSASYIRFPEQSVLFRKYNGIVIDDESVLGRSGSFELIEANLQFDLPIKQTILIDSASNEIEIVSPYSSKLETFTKDSYITASQNFLSFFRNGPKFDYKSPKQTFFNIIKTLPENVNEINFERLENIFPRKDLVGKAFSRTKPSFEEQNGEYINSSTRRTWSFNSYNKTPNVRRKFWADNLIDRRGAYWNDAFPKIGIFNCLGYANQEQPSYYICNSQVTTRINLGTGQPNEYDEAGKPYMRAAYNEGILLLRTYQQATPYRTWHKLGFSWSSEYKKTNSVYSLDGYTQISTGSLYQLFLLSPPRRIGNSFINYSNSTLGDLAPLTNADAYRMTKYGLNDDYTSFNTVIPKPQFVFNNDFGYSVVYNDFLPGDFFSAYVVSCSFIINNSYQSELDPNLKPAYNSYLDFFENIKHKSQNYSIIPEFTIEKNSSIVRSNDFSSKNLTLLGNESHNEIDRLPGISKDFNIVDFPKFINGDSNTIKIVVNGVKKLLPYNGFYANQRIPQLVNLFSSSYLASSIPYNIYNPSDGFGLSSTNSSSTSVQRAMQIILQPFFAPGILNNTIKAGLAVDYPVTLFNSSSYNSLHQNIERFLFDRLQVIKELNFRVPFEAILDPKSYFQSPNDLNLSEPSLHYLDPTRFFWTAVENSASAKPTYNLKHFKENNNPLYRWAINNFLSEIPNFFLENSQLNYFASKPEKEFKSVIPNQKYKMFLKIEKSNNFSMFTTGSGNFIPVESLFGPPSRFYSGSVETTDLSDPKLFYPYAPPYFRGGSNLVFEYTPEDKDQHGGAYVPSLEDIFNEKNLKIYEDIAATELSASGPSTEITSYFHRMLLNNSMNLKRKIEERKKSINQFGAQTATTEFENKNAKWIIQTKFETPLINYTNTTPDPAINTIPSQEYIIKTETSEAYDELSDEYFVSTSSYSADVNYKYSSVNGIWNRLGEVPEDLSSVQISLLPEISASNKDNPPKSLLEVCGFQPSVKSIGKLANNKKISEAVLLIPFVEKPTDQQINSGFLYKNDNWFSVKSDRYLFALNNEKINSALGVPNYQDESLRSLQAIIKTNSSIDRNSILFKMLKNLTDYNVPPSLNFLFNRNIKPFVMYFAEFTHDLSKEDLSKIWQGSLPTIGTTPEEQQIVIEHQITDLFPSKQFLDSLNVKFYVFKVKKTANSNYNYLLDNIENYNLFNSLSPSTYNETPEFYSFNWPYDYFSLVELVNIQAGELKQKQQQQINILTPGAEGSQNNRLVIINPFNTTNPFNT